MFSLNQLCRFVAENQNMFGAQAPHIIARAMRHFPCLMFEASTTHQIFGVDEDIEKIFLATITTPPYLELFRQRQLDLRWLLLALFTNEELEELRKLPIENFSQAPKAIGDMLRAKGVDWVDTWVQVE